jgi:diguanylate cyclase (GGDEF)-like protein/PAS domain S-box-containing protein
MYDADFRLVVCNQNYIDMYAMPENLTRPGTHFDDVMAYRIASGATPIDGDKNFTTKVYEAARAHKTNLLTYRLKDGRIITITQQPMSDGGFVSTHEDITAEMARIEALEARESELEKSNLRFEAAVNNIAHGLVMFDRHQRVVICNKAYARLYNLPEELTRPGTTLTQIVENRVSQGIIRAADRDAMLRHWQDVGAAGKPHEEVVELADGRVVSLVHRPMSDGGWVATHEDITERRRAEAALAEAENRWKFALEGAGQGVWDADLVKGTMYYSPQWRLIRGFAPDAEINGSRASWLARVHPDDRQRLMEITDGQNAGTRPFDQFEYRERHQRTGEWIWILSRGKPISWQANGKPARIIGTDTDITRQKELELKLESNLALLHTTFENYPGGICLIDHNLILSLANANYYEMLGLDKDQFPPGTPLREIMTSLAERGYYGSGRTDDTVAGRLEFASRFEPVTFERRLADGRIFEFKRSPLPAGGFVQTIEDVTDARRNEERIRYLARHDQLTDLPNRMRFVEEMGHVEEAIRRGEKIAVIALDLDRFKTINDTLGHSAGDAVLRHVGNLINSVLRERDFAARLGGDEFAIIAYGVEEPAHAAKIAARIVQLLTKPLEVEGHRIMVGTSIGIAIAPNDGTETDVLMKNADLALYRAKAEGRGAYHFFQKGMDAALQRRRVIEEGLKQALARDEFRLVYQPIFDLKELKILGFEALLRWRSSSGEEIGPGEFIPVAEETGLILPIGEWVLRNACKTAASWPARVGVAVNISAVQFRARNLIELVTEALQSSGLEAERLELEITESLMLADSAHTLETLHGLRKLGVRISMDDFGTGYSSLAYFRSFPFDKIKIDRSFISELGRRQDNLAIITAVIGLSRSLGMSTIAEGIETEEQMQMLRAEGCEEAQGFLFSPPLPASAIPALLGADESLVRRPIGETA